MDPIAVVLNSHKTGDAYRPKLYYMQLGTWHDKAKYEEKGPHPCARKGAQNIVYALNGRRPGRPLLFAWLLCQHHTCVYLCMCSTIRG